MKIEKIKKQRNGRYELYLTNHDKIVTYDDVILKNQLLYHPDLDAKELEQINQDTNYYDIYYKLVKLISTKLRSEKEVRLYLHKFNLTSQDEQQMIDELKQAGLINEVLFAKAYAADHFHLNKEGPNKIRQALEAYELDEALINETLADISDEVPAMIESLIIKRSQANTKDSEYLKTQKITHYLLDKGYDYDLIKPLLCKIEGSDQTALAQAYQKLTNKDQAINKLMQKGFKYNEIKTYLEKQKRA